MGAVVALSCVLSACAGGGIFSKPPPPTYDLTTPRQIGRAGGAAQLTVAEPSGVSVLDTDKVLVRSASGEVSTLPNAQWSDRLPRLLQARIVQAFENANRRGVGKAGDRLTSDFQLLTDLRAFQISVGDGSTAEVEIAARIVSDSTGRVVAARIFRASVPLENSQPNVAMQALDAAFGRTVTDLVRWANRNV